MITMKPVLEVEAGDVLSTDGYRVVTVDDRNGYVVVTAELEGHRKQATLHPSTSLPIWAPDRHGAA